MKKVIAAVLAASTVASLASISAFAAKEYTYAVPDAAMYTDNDTTKGYSDPVKPDSSIYILLDSVIAAAPGTFTLGPIDEDYLSDGDYFKAKFDKGDNNARMIKKMSVVEEKDQSNNRKWWIKIEINDDYTDKEYKLTPSISFTAKATNAEFTALGGNNIQNGDKIYVEPVIFVSNATVDADYDTDNGTGGIVIKPVKDDNNEITWSDENNEVARLTFIGDSDTNKFFPKLSTKWNNDDYQALFANQNAFKFEFVAQPTISSTSRATLELYNPYIDENGDETIDPTTITIYEVQADSTLLDVTDRFTYGSNDNDNYVFTTQTRTLGYYIMAEEPIDQYDDVDEDIDLDEIDNIIVDDDTTKLPPNTGSF